MTTTDANGIQFLQDTDNIAPFQTLINGLQTATSTAIDTLRTNGAGPFICTSTTHPTNTALRNGMLVYETDTALIAKYSTATTRWTYLGVGFDACAWKLDTAMNLSLGAFTKVAWGTQIETDLDAGITYASGNVTVAKAGIYDVVGSLVFDNPAGTGTKRLSEIITVNCTSINGSGIVASGYIIDAQTQIVSGIAALTAVNLNLKCRRLKLNAGDYISTFAFTDIGGVALSTHLQDNYSGYSYLSVERVA